MDYLGNLIIIGIYVMLEVKFDEQIGAELNGLPKTKVRLQHSVWQNAGRGLVILAIIWNQPMNNQIIALSTFCMYTTWYWALFDSVFARGVLKKPPWFLGSTSRIDRFFPMWSHIPIWVAKWLAFGASVYWVLKTA